MKYPKDSLIHQNDKLNTFQMFNYIEEYFKDSWDIFNLIRQILELILDKPNITIEKH